MATTPEGKVKAQVKKILTEGGAYYHCPVQNGMGAPTLDFVGCAKITITPDMVGREVGLFFSVETKAAGKCPTERQKETIRQMTSAAANVFVIDGTTNTTTYEDLERWINQTEEDHDA